MIMAGPSRTFSNQRSWWIFSMIIIAVEMMSNKVQSESDVSIYAIAMVDTGGGWGRGNN